MQSLAFLRAWRSRARSRQDLLPAPPMPLHKERFEEALKEGRPLSTVIKPPVPGVAYADSLIDLLTLLMQQGGPTDQASLTVIALRDAEEAEKEALAKAARDEDGEALLAWATAKGLNPEILNACLGLALQPFLGRYGSEMVKEAPMHLWRNNFCPCCGRQPDVTRVDPDNQRYLHCPQCDTQWLHYRLTCTRCDTDDIKKVNILIEKELEPWRVEVCDVCGDYCKTLDQRHGGVLAMPDVDLFLEDARTARLDLLAEAEGYRRGGRLN